MNKKDEKSEHIIGAIIALGLMQVGIALPLGLIAGASTGWLAVGAGISFMGIGFLGMIALEHRREQRGED